MTDTLAHLLCRGMLARGIDRLYCLPGVQNDDFFNALVDFPDLVPIVTRHEQACSYMATGAALATGKAQAYCTVPGQGVLNASAGHSTAFATSARILALAGQNKTEFVGRMHGMLHEIPDQMAVLGQMSKHAAALRDPVTATGQIADAFHHLVSGHPKPVTVECPLDLWIAPADEAAFPEPEFPAVDTDAIEQAADLIAASERPMIVLGGGAHDAAEAIAELAAMLKCPVSALRQGKGAYDETGPLAVMGPVAHEFWKTVDVAIGIGTRFQWHEQVWGVDADIKLIQINADPVEVNRRGNIAVPINAMAEHAVPLLVEALAKKLGARADRTDEIARLNAGHAEAIAKLQPTEGDLAVISEVLGPEGIFVDDLTQVAYAARYILKVQRPRGYVCAGYAGTLGWGTPAGIGAALAAPDRRVLVVQGDGGFMYGAAELATAARYKVPVVILVYNDNAYGNVQRIQQQRFGHNRVVATDLTNPDFVKFAESFGIHAQRVKAGSGGLKRALEAAFACGGPALVEVACEERYPDPWPLIFRPTVRGPKQAPLLANP